MNFFSFFHEFFGDPVKKANQKRARQVSIDRFADRLVELLIIENSLPHLRSILAKEGPLNEAEALIYLLAPFHVMTGSNHFKNDAAPLMSALVTSLAKRGRRMLTPDSVMQRLVEYGVVLFDPEGKRRLSVSELGLHHLARSACRHILSREVQDPLLLLEVWSLWSATFTSWKGGEGLKDLFTNYMELHSCDDEWAAAVRRAIHSASSEYRSTNKDSIQI